MSELAWPVAPPSSSWIVDAAPPSMPAEVWVAVIVVQYQVSRRDIPVTTPLTSAAMLFAPRTEETMTTAKVVAAAANEQDCRQALSAWKQANPGIGGDEIVTAVAFGPDVVSVPARATTRCIDCGREIGDGFRCDPCVKVYWQSLRDADPDWATETA